MSWKRSILHVVLAASVCTSALLAHSVVRQRHIIAGLTARHILSRGMQAPSLDLVSVEGRAVRVQYNDSDVPTVLYVVSPTCKWCLKNANSVAALYNQVGKAARFVGVSIMAQTPVKTDAAPIPMAPFPMLTGPDDVVGKRLLIRSTPTTIVVSNEGVVLAVWEGAYGADLKARVEQHFKVHLPDFDGR